MIYFGPYRETIFQRKTSKGKEEHIYSIFKQNNEEINNQKSVWELNISLRGCLFGEAVSVKYLSLYV